MTGEGTILLVEDEEGLRALNARGLASRGYTVLEAGNGLEAIDVLEKSNGRVDLVVSDVVMPEMDGPTLAHELRTPQSRPEDHLRLRLRRGRVRKASARSHKVKYGFLPKPFTLKQLVAAVKETLAALMGFHPPRFAGQEEITAPACRRGRRGRCRCPLVLPGVGTSHLVQAASATLAAAMTIRHRARPAAKRSTLDIIPPPNCNRRPVCKRPSMKSDCGRLTAL